MEKEVQAGALEVIPAEDARLMFCGKTHFRIRINYIYFDVYIYCISHCMICI